ncbi:hypothetical protein [Pseudoalteromonas luteoviolacea]|uniref:hypothetical protein n=1 Tax=Pseudoalteromonas luteoviolacea TaxID=43657 RepID=UPI001B35F778|nr:hypothetical protein [Pseudoalteromonas luteoviolacea]MBQ4840142.1 hypothetical protein [Pseudoalteromonas luteoviolacea]
MSNNHDQSETAIFIGLFIAAVPLFIIKHKTGLSFQTIIQTVVLWALFGGAIWLNKQTQTILHIGSHWNILLAVFLLTLIPIANELGTTMESTRSGPLAFLDDRTRLEAPKWYAETFWQVFIVMTAVLSKYAFAWIREKFEN